MALPQDGQNANGLTKVTQIPAGKELMFIDPTTNEGGIITLEDLTKQILNGLASQAFALDAGQMTLPAALNYLYGNALGFNNGMIRDYTIKNDKYYSILPLGCYELQNASLTYFPTRWGILLHFRGDINYGIFLAIHTDGTVYVRLYSLENNDWYTGWVKLAKG